MYQYGEADQWLHRYSYDADNRLEWVRTSMDAFLWDEDARYDYYAHGRLARVETGHYKVQGSDYFYTLQGWLKGLNMPFAGDPGGDGVNPLRTSTDAFAFALGYYQNDYQPIGGTGLALTDGRDKLWTRYAEQHPEQTAAKGLYNGNIAWMVTDVAELGKQSGNDRTKGMQGMLYRYDQVNRIIASRSLTSYAATTGFAARTAGVDAAFDTQYSYDPNGNLLTQQRRDDKNGLADDLDYQYYANTNRLQSANSTISGEKIYSSGAVKGDDKVYSRIYLQNTAYVASGNSVVLKASEKITTKANFTIQAGGSVELQVQDPALVGGYRYNAIGNLIEDQGEGVTIEWTVYGKVRQVTHKDGTVVGYHYDATGNRVAKLVTKGSATTTTRYLRDASGNVMAIYQAEELIEQPIYGSSRMGLYRGGRLPGQRQLGHKQYELSNHLGNVYVTIGDEKIMTSVSGGSSGPGFDEPGDPDGPPTDPGGDPDALATGNTTVSVTAAIKSYSHYYPFGLDMPGLGFHSDSYR
ncbi:MAG: hypothetical protein V4714_12215, partial [Bacteroidota bacterium]